MGGHERDHDRRVEADVDGVVGRGQEEEERSAQRRLLPDGKMKVGVQALKNGGKFQSGWREKNTKKTSTTFLQNWSIF